jgi:peptidoglycan/xylan/chitin deacetylase (PgdA/CDA1 family)
MSTVETNSALLFDEALDLALNQLTVFSKSPRFIDQMTVAFGSSWSPIIGQKLITDLATGQIPPIEVVANLGGAQGAYGAASNKIYLSERFLLANQNNPQAIANVLLEEIGHSIDARLNSQDNAGDEGAIFAALVNNRSLSSAELTALKTENDQKTLVINGQATAIEQATYGSINVDGNLADWTATERIDTAPGSGQAGYEVYGKYAANNYIFGIKSAVAIGNGSTIWIDADQNATTGYQIFGFAGGAEYNIQIGTDGKANLYSGNEGQTFVSALDYSLSADGKNLEVAVAGTALGTTTPAAINVLADVNNSVYLPGDYSLFKYTVAQTTTGPKTTYGNITLDGTLADWTASDRLDVLPGSGQAGYEVYGKNTVDGYAFAIKSAVNIGTNTTLWLDTDKNKATGFQIFGFAGGAERNINIAADGNAYLYSGGAGQTFITKLDSKISADGKTLEVAVGKDQIAAGNGLNVLADVNDNVFLPGDYSTTPYSVSNAVTATPPTTPVYGNITIDGGLTDWKSLDRLDYQPGVAQAGYQVFGKSTADGYVFAINSAIAVGANTTVWLDTDQNKTTGFQIFGTTPTSAGAEYNINIAADGNAYLYTGGAGQNIVAKLDSKLSADGKQWEVGVSKTLLPVTGPGINVLADVNNTVFLPGDYNRSPLTISNTPLPTRTDLSKKVGIVYSETSANKFFDKKAYNQLFGNAQNQAMQAGVNFDILTEADLKDLNKVVQYDSLVFAGFANVKAGDVAAIENVLTQASAKYGVGMIAAGDFMSNDETGAALAGDPYQRLKNLFDVNRTGGGTVTGATTGTGGAVSVNIKDTTSPILESSYTAGEQIASYANNLTFSAYAGLTQTGTVLADQTINGQKYNAVIATQTGGRNVHFADQSIFADSNLGWQGLNWSVYGNQVKVGLDMTRNKSMFISRDDVDQSKFSLEAPALEAKVGDILADWKGKYGFVGSHYINIGVDGSTPAGQNTIACCCPYCASTPGSPEGTNWEVMRPIYQKWLDLGNEIGTHSYTHPANVSQLTAAQLEFEFNQSKQIISQQLGIPVNGAATPGNPENLFVDQELSKYFQYVSGVGSAYTNSFGYLEPGNNTLFFAPNISFDFNLIDFKKLTTAQAEAVWAQEYAQLTKHGNNPFIEFSWHDYAVTGSQPGYTRAMFDNFISRAYNDGTEFITLDDAQKRIRAFDAAKLTVNQVGDTITASIADATDIGKFALDIDAGNKVIKSVTNYYAYDNDSVFTTKTGGSYTINLGTTVDDVSHITSLDQRNELVAVTGNGTNLNFSFNGAGKITTDMKAIAATERYKVTGADDFKVTGDKLELIFNNNTAHTVAITVGADDAPIVATPLAAITTTADAPGTKSIDLSKVFSDIDKDAITISVVGNTNTNLLKTTLTGTTLNLNYVPYEFGTSTITLRGTAGGKSVDTSFNVSLNNVTPIILGNDNAQTINGGAGNEIIKGLLGNDRLNGNNGDDVLIGGGGNDTLVGGAGNDVLLGANPMSATPGTGSYDVLQGDAGNDRYILGDVNFVYYNDGISTNTGRSDYAAIIGFATGDIIQLKGKAADYTLSVGTAPNNGTQQGTLIQSTLFGQPELIGFVAGSTNLSLTSTTFSYV